MLSRLGDGSYAQPSKVTLAAFLRDEWLPAIEGTVRPLTYAQHMSTVRARIVPHLGHVRLQTLTGAHLNAFYRELEQAGLSVATRRQARRRRSFALPRARPGRQVPALASRSTTGMRRGELLGLTWRSLDLEGARLSVEQHLVPTTGGVTFGPPKSARSRRTIALDEVTVRILNEHREIQLAERAFAGPAYVDADLVFADALGAPIHPQRLTERFGNRRKAAGIPTGTMHILRHTAATLALTEGVPVHIVAARLGDDSNTVLSTYAHLLPQSDELAADRVAVLLAG